MGRMGNTMVRAPMERIARATAWLWLLSVGAAALASQGAARPGGRVQETAMAAGPQGQAPRQRARVKSGGSRSKATVSPCDDEKLLFHCYTTTHKEVRVCDRGTTLEYLFRSPGLAPELLLPVPRKQAVVGSWSGIGRSMDTSLAFPNGDVTYTVFWSVDRLDEEHPVEAGVAVERNGKQIARVLCQEPVVHKLWDLEPGDSGAED